MKIAVVSSNVFAVGKNGNPLGGYGGLEPIAYYTAKGLAAKGHQVTLVAPDGSECPGCVIHFTGPPGRWDEHAAFKGFKYPDKEGKEVKVEPSWPVLLQQDVIIDHSWSKQAYCLKEEGALTAPVLGVCHAPVNTMYQSLPEVEKPCFVCISQDQANHFNALFCPRYAEVCYNGVDLDVYRPINTPRTNRFLFLARFSTIKAPDTAISACKKAGVGLDVIGDTSITNEPEFFQQCLQMCDGEQIRIVGSVPRGETVWWYSQAQAMLHPNHRFREPFGLAPVEAMLCGCPVIGWRYGAMPETVKHEESGVLATNLDEFIWYIQEIAKGGDIPSEERAKYREWAKKFSIENMVDRYEELCTLALKTGGW